MCFLWSVGSAVYRLSRLAPGVHESVREECRSWREGVMLCGMGRGLWLSAIPVSFFFFFFN